jgi:hypothetical protein
VKALAKDEKVAQEAEIPTLPSSEIIFRQTDPAKLKRVRVHIVVPPEVNGEFILRDGTRREEIARRDANLARADNPWTVDLLASSRYELEHIQSDDLPVIIGERRKTNPMSSSSPDPDATGTLVVELPHWAATVRISDNLYRPVASRLLSKERSDPPRGLPLESTLAGGVYNVEVTLAGATDSEWVSVRPGRTTRIPAERWHKLQRLSSAPLADAGPEALQREPAEQWSRQRTWAAAPGGTARLFIFVRTDDPKRFPRFPEGLLLLNAAEEPVIGLTDGAQMDRQAGWMAFNADLSPGYYILCRKRSGVMVRHQPIFLCHGWETQIFIKARKNPSLRTLAMHMAPLGQGFRHDDEIAAAADAILDALLHDQELRSVVGSSHLSTLLRGEHKNPWLGILGCYAITTFLTKCSARKTGPRAGGV